MGVLSLTDVTMQDVNLVGGKAASLGELLHANHRVAPGFVITADQTQMSAELVKEVVAALDRLGLTRVAVRSSGVSEDSKDQSWAGQFVTVLHVQRDGLLKAIQDCWDSATTARAAAYGQPGQLAVLVQQMIDGDVSGVAFSVNPVSGSADELMIEAVIGLCEPLVQGTATPDNYLINKTTNAVVSKDIVQSRPVLSGKQIQAVAALTKSIEDHYGFAVDIEWSFQNDQLYLLQARPITTV